MTVTVHSPAGAATGDRTQAAIAYVLLWITGLVILLIAKKDDHYARWHAIQAIGLGIAATAVSILLSLFRVPLLGMLFNVLVLVLVVVLAVKAYQGEKIRLPLIADYADRSA